MGSVGWMGRPIRQGAEKLLSSHERSLCAQRQPKLDVIQGYNGCKISYILFKGSIPCMPAL